MYSTTRDLFCAIMVVKLKTMPLALIEKEGIELSFGIAPRIPYLDAVEQYIQTH